MRGRLPDPDNLDVGEALGLYVEAEATAACDRKRGDELAALVVDFNVRWQAWLAENYPNR